MSYSFLVRKIQISKWRSLEQIELEVGFHPEGRNGTVDETNCNESVAQFQDHLRKTNCGGKYSGFIYGILAGSTSIKSWV